MFDPLKINDTALKEAKDIVAYLYDCNVRAISRYGERAGVIQRCLFTKYGDKADNLSADFYDASLYFAKVLSMKFEDHYKLKRSRQLDFDCLIEAIFRRGRTDAEIRLLMVKYFKEPIGSLGYPLKKVL